VSTLCTRTHFLAGIRPLTAAGASNSNIVGFFWCAGYSAGLNRSLWSLVHTVTRQTTEIGIRMALGAQARSVQWLVLRETLLLVLIGVAIGLPVALASTRLISSQLFGLTPFDPITIAMATLLLIAVAAFAGYLPARRASRVDPMVALRYE
jgi:ABC-type antimicrobial peptide transport system permease subunit